MVWYMRGISLLLCINSHEPVYEQWITPLLNFKGWESFTDLAKTL